MTAAPSRRRSPFSRRPARLALLGFLLVAAAATAVRVVVLRTDDRRDRWKRHDEALVLFESARYGEAAAVYRSILEEQPRDRVARFNLGLALVRSGDDGGWAEIADVARQDPAFDDAQIALADHAVEVGDVAGAARCLEVAVEQPPEPPGVRVRLAELLFGLGRRGEAMRQLERVLQRSEDPPIARASAAVRLAREHGRQADLHRSPADERARAQKAYRFALHEIERSGVLTRAPEDWDDETRTLGALRAFALAGTGEQELALGAVETALRAPQSGSSRAGLRVLRAQLYWMEGDPSRAESELRDVLSDPGSLDADAYLAASDLYEGRGNRERAVAVLRSGLTAHPDDDAIRLSLARLLFLTGAAEQVEVVLRGGAEIPSSDAALLFLGDLRRYQGDRMEARRAYEILRERHPQSRQVSLRLASLDAQAALDRDEPGLVEAGALEAAAREAIARDPADAEALLALARSRLLRLAAETGGAEDEKDVRLRDVRDLLQSAVDADPLLFEGHVLLAHVEARLGAYATAAVGLERVLAALPNERPVLRILLAQAYLGLDAPSRALEEARRAVEGMGNDPRALRAVLEAARAAGDGAAAIDSLERLVSLAPRSVDLRLELSAQHEAEGDAAAADAQLAEAEAVAAAIAGDEPRARALQSVTDARAKLYSARGDRAAGRIAFERLLAQYPNRAEAHVVQGRFLRSIGSGAEAEAAFRAALASDPESLVACRQLVDLWAEAGQISTELTAMVRRMRQIGGDDPVVLYAEGRLAALQGDLRVAREKLEACAPALRGDADVQFALGVVLGRAGRLDDAVAALERATALAPRSTRARDALARTRFALAQELARLGRLRAAREMLEGSVRDDPDAATPRHALASLLGMTEGTEAGEAQIREMLSRDPDDVVLRRMLAAALAQKRDLAGATRELRRVAESLPDDWTVWATLAVVRLRAGDEGGAAQFAARAREVAPDEPRALGPTLQLLADTDRGAEARALLDAAITEHPAEPQYLLLRAVLNARVGRHEDVVTDCSRALELAPGMTGAAHLAVHALRFGLGDPARAEELVQTWADRAPDVAEYAFLLGWLASDRGDGERAIAVLRPLSETDPPHQPALESTALLLMRRAENAAARELLDTGLAANPENPNFHYLRVQTLLADAVAAGDRQIEGPSRDVIVAGLERTLDLAPQHHTARNNLAFVLAADDEQLPEALEHALRATREAPRHAPYADTLGTIQLRMGRVEDAVASFERGLAIVADGRGVLDREGAAAAAALPGRVERMRARLQRQEAELRRHLDEALRRRRGE